MLILERNKGFTKEMSGIKLWTILLSEFYTEIDNLIVKCFYLVQNVLRRLII